MSTASSGSGGRLAGSNLEETQTTAIAVVSCCLRMSAFGASQVQLLIRFWCWLCCWVVDFVDRRGRLFGLFGLAGLFRLRGQGIGIGNETDRLTRITAKPEALDRGRKLFHIDDITTFGTLDFHGCTLLINTGVNVSTNTQRAIQPITRRFGSSACSSSIVG